VQRAGEVQDLTAISELKRIKHEPSDADAPAGHLPDRGRPAVADQVKVGRVGDPLMALLEEVERQPVCSKVRLDRSFEARAVSLVPRGLHGAVADDVRRHLATSQLRHQVIVRRGRRGIGRHPLERRATIARYMDARWVHPACELAFGVVRPVDLTTLDGLSEVLGLDVVPSWLAFDGAYCPGCGDSRRMEVTVDFWREKPDPPEDKTPLALEPKHVPAVVRLFCVQCRQSQTLVLFKGPTGVELVTLHSGYGGLTTPNCPPAVAYYLDQAQRAQSAGALSAATAMYRSALEHLLFEQGFTDRMLGPKIQSALAADPPPAWLRDLHPEFLRVIKELGDAAIHPNDGDVERQRAFDSALLRRVRELFVELLHDVYELPHQRARRLEEMQAARAVLHRSAGS
jgi:hypothetical protein